MADTYSLSLAQVEELTRTISPDIIGVASLVTNKVFDDLKINVITDIENIDKLWNFEGKRGTVRKYEPGKLKPSAVGRMFENKLKVTLAAKLVPDNIQQYREKEPFHVATDGSHTATNSEFLIRKLAELYAGDILMNLFFGKEGNANPAYGLYDGYFTLIEKMKNSGFISTTNKNLIETDEIDTLSASDPEDQNYQIFKGFVQSLDPRLLAQPEVLVYASPVAKNLIVAGYMKAYPQLAPTVLADGWRFAEFPNIVLVSTPAMGTGSALIATTPNNFDYGCDIDPANGQASLSVALNPDDHNVLNYQIQTAQGVRIRSYFADAFACNNKSNTPYDAAFGEYVNETIEVSVNDSTMGTASITSGAKTTYEAGDNVTITATPKTGYKFVMWSDGVTIATRTYVFTGESVKLQAVFQAESVPASSASSASSE